MVQRHIIGGNSYFTNKLFNHTKPGDLINFDKGEAFRLREIKEQLSPTVNYNIVLQQSTGNSQRDSR